MVQTTCQLRWSKWGFWNVIPVQFGGFLKWGYPIAGWFIVEILLKWMIWEYPYFRMRRAGRNPRVFWLSWVDLHGIESTFMFLPTGWKPNQRFACFYVFHGVNGVGWGGVITSICTAWHTWCYAAVRLFALPHMHDATLLYVFLHVLTYMMLRCCTSSCTSSHLWCYATVCRLALPHIYDATLVYVSLAQWQDLDACSRLAVEMGKQFPQKPLQVHCRNCEEHLAQEKRECRWGFLHIQWKVRAYFLRKLNFERDAKPLWFVVWNQWRTLQTLKTRVW